MKINDCMRCFEHKTLILTHLRKTNDLIRWEKLHCAPVLEIFSTPIASVGLVIYIHLKEYVPSALPHGAIQR